MKTLTLSGWGQQSGTLAGVVGGTATHFDYSGYKNIDEALSAIAKATDGHEVVVGWSLGGQLAVRAISKGLMLPEKLVLIAVPFQFVHSEAHKIGMPRDTFQKFRDNYKNNAARTLSKAWELVILNDKNHEQVRSQLEKYNKQRILEKDWLHWLQMLDGFSCSELDFNNFPQTLIIHGAQDAVVDHSQAQEFIKVIAQAQHIILPEAGHAPHWHDAGFVRKQIGDFLRV